MNVFTAYIVKEVLKSAVITLMILLMLFNLFTFTDEMKDLGKGYYGIQQIFAYLALTTPEVIYELIPASALIGSLFVLGAMANNREIVAMRASGLSLFGIIKALLIAGVILVTLSLILGEFIAPLTEKMAQKLKTSAISEQVVMNTKYGLWLREGSDFINVREVDDDGKLADISIYKLDEHRHMYESAHADAATFIGDKTWKLHKIKRSSITTGQISISQEDEVIWKTDIAPNLFKIVVVEPSNLSLYDLAMYINFLKANHQKSHTYEVAFWGRAINPVTTFVMLLVATPFVIGIHRGISVGARIMIGVTLGMAFNIFDKIVNHMSLIYNLNPPLMSLLPSMTVMIFVFFAMRRSKI